MLLNPIQQGDFILGQLGQNAGHLVALAQLLLHVRLYLGDSGVARMGVEGREKVQLGVFLNLHPQLMELEDRSVAGQEILGTGAEGDNLQVLQANHRAGNGQEVLEHIRDFPGGSHGVFGDIGLYAPQGQVVAGVEHTAVCVAAGAG